MKNIMILFTLVFASMSAHANSDIVNRVERFDWDGIDVVWLQDDRLPLFNIQVYFADGALSDDPSRMGETEFMFTMLSEGTRRFSASEIADSLEFFGSSYGASVVHEYSQFKVSGLLEHMAPTMEMVCHMFQDSTFPRERINNALAKRKAQLENSIRNHGWLANRAFRELSLRGSPFYYPTDGKINDLDRVTRTQLREKRNYFNNDVKKRIYLTGPREVLGLRNIIREQCGWRGHEEQFVRRAEFPPVKIEDGPQVFVVEVPSANQAQVRIGRILNPGEYDDHYSMLLANNFLGGGFTSRLMREVRASRGLTYSIGSMAAAQRDYGRALISTSTPAPRVTDLLEVITNTVQSAMTVIDSEDLERSRGNLIGSHPFQFESPEGVLGRMMFLDHQERPYDELTHFPQRVAEVTKEQVKEQLTALFRLDRQVIVVLGEADLAEQLREAGYKNIITMSFRDFL